jgi:N-acetylneuraminic acid mutarotase
MAQDWEALPDMPFDGKWETGAVVLDGKLYFFGGFTGGNTWSSDLATHRLKKRVDVFNTKDRGWTQVLDMPSAISHFNTVLDGRTVWIAGGGTKTGGQPKVKDSSPARTSGPPRPSRNG